MRILLFLTLLTFLPGLAQAAQRLGLIIGNDIYDEVPSLQKARSDATAISNSLTSLGFETITVLDANRRAMNRAISEFTSRLRPGDTALVFFAGHGVEIDGENYLLPTDIVSPGQASEDFVKFESISLSDLLFAVQSTGARTTLVFLDACRDNPFAEAGGRTIGGTRGLARITAPEGTFVVFSAGARQQALDSLHAQDRDKNSVFTRLLLPKLSLPGLELRQLISELRVEVRDLAKTRQHNQFPAYYDELLGEFFFNDTTSTPGTPTSPAPTPLTAEIANNIHEDFRLTKSVNTPTAYRAFLSRYAAFPDALPVTLAQQLLASLEADASATQNRELALLTPVETETPNDAKQDTQSLDQPGPTLSSREITRLSQDLLNEHGCDAGVADGFIGRRTRAAFSRFIDQSGSTLEPSSLGTQAALSELQSHTVVVCTKPVVVAAAPPKTTPKPIAAAPKAKAPTPAPKAKAPVKAATVSLKGRWNAITTGCVNRRKIRAQMSHISSTSYRFTSTIVGLPSDYGARGIVRVSGRTLKADLSSELGTSGGWTGTVASNGQSFKVTERSGCSYSFKR